MRVRIMDHVRREPDGRGGFRESDATPPFVEVGSGEYRGRFERGREYDVTAAEGQVVMATGFFEEVGPRAGETFPTDAEIEEARRAEAEAKAAESGEVPAGVPSTSGTATAQQHEVTNDAPGVPVTPLSASPGDAEAIRAHAAAPEVGVEVARSGGDRSTVLTRPAAPPVTPATPDREEVK